MSIGLVAEDGHELYLQSTEFDPTKAVSWIDDHVYPQLSLCPHIHTRGEPHPLADRAAHEGKGQCTYEVASSGYIGLRGVRLAPAKLIGTHADCPWRTRAQIKQELLSFLDVSKYGFPEFWGYYGAYDHIALAQIFGKMIDFPTGWPMFTFDLNQLAYHLGYPTLPPQEEGEHNALEDARWNKKVWDFLNDYALRQGIDLYGWKREEKQSL